VGNRRDTERAQQRGSDSHLFSPRAKRKPILYQRPSRSLMETDPIPETWFRTLRRAFYGAESDELLKGLHNMGLHNMGLHNMGLHNMPNTEYTRLDKVAPALTKGSRYRS
jgi:hypothetical protein